MNFVGITRFFKEFVKCANNMFKSEENKVPTTGESFLAARLVNCKESNKTTPLKCKQKEKPRKEKKNL